MFRVLAGILAVLFTLTLLVAGYLALTASRPFSWWMLLMIPIVIVPFARYAIRGNPPARAIPQRKADSGAP